MYAPRRGQGKRMEVKMGMVEERGSMLSLL